MWRLIVDLPDAAGVEQVIAALDEGCDAVSAFEQPGGGWRIEGLSAERPNQAVLDASFALVLDRAPTLHLERLAPRDWVSENQAGFPPIRVGRFFIYGSHYRDALPRDAIPILIDAATAFGTGEHATTRGCLLAMEMVAKRTLLGKPSSFEGDGTNRENLKVLDIGCGTGILSIAAAKCWRRPVLAFDIDPEAVRVTRVNARCNQVTAAVRTHVAVGYCHRDIARQAPFNLVFANILARPLMGMAPDLARVLAPGGVAILSGLLARQAPAVLAAHRTQGLFLRARIALEGWHTLVVAKRGSQCPDCRR